LMGQRAFPILILLSRPRFIAFGSTETLSEEAQLGMTASRQQEPIKPLHRTTRIRIYHA
jgi:hypothetical protein